MPKMKLKDRLLNPEDSLKKLGARIRSRSRERPLSRQDRDKVEDIKKDKPFHTPCTCDKCAPQRYVYTHEHHHHISLATMRDLKPQGRLFYEPLEAAKLTITFSSGSWENFDEKQRESLHEIWRMIQRDDFERKLNKKRCGEVSIDGMLKLCNALNNIFFFGLAPIKRFEWKDYAQNERNELIDGWPECMTLSSEADSWPIRSTRAAHCVSMLLRKMILAFLYKVSCRECPTYHLNFAFNDGVSNGFGRAWHLIAAAVEEVGTRLLRFGKLDLCRLATILWWRDQGVFEPSEHDMVMYGLMTDETGRWDKVDLQDRFQGPLRVANP